MTAYELWFDGGIKSATKGIPFGSFEIIVTCDAYSELSHGVNRWIIKDLVVTSNHAEYLALEAAITYFIKNYEYVVRKKDSLTLCGDSELVRKQIGTYNEETTFWDSWKCNFDKFQIIQANIRRCLESLIKHQQMNVAYIHVPRKQIVKKFGH